MTDAFPKPDNYSEVCECGQLIPLSETWWHRSVCPVHKRPLQGMVQAVARALAVEEGEAPDAWQLYTGQAKAAIAALRQPTSTMIEAGSTTVWNRDALVAAYQAMIDAAGSA